MTQTPVSTTPAVPTPMGGVIDLDAQRKVRAAAREGKKQPLVIVLGGETVATLPVELPLDVFSPLRALDNDLSIVLRQGIAAYRSQGEERVNNMEVVVDILAANPDLPVSVLDVVTDIAKRLLSEDGYDALMGQRPSLDDLSFLGRTVLDFYGVSLGESQPLSDSPSSAGQTSNEISSTTPEEASTPAVSGATETTPTSSESAAS